MINGNTDSFFLKGSHKFSNSVLGNFTSESLTWVITFGSSFPQLLEARFRYFYPNYLTDCIKIMYFLLSLSFLHIFQIPLKYGKTLFSLRQVQLGMAHIFNYLFFLQYFHTDLSVSQFEYCPWLVLFQSMTGLDVSVTKIDMDLLKNMTYLILQSSMICLQPPHIPYANNGHLLSIASHFH